MMTKTYEPSCEPPEEKPNSANVGIPMEAKGLNPHYKPPVMRWNQLEIMAPVGYTFGIVMDSMGLLAIAVKPPNGEWPKGYEPVEGINTIKEGDICYSVLNDERGPAREHEFEPGEPTDLNSCKVCQAQTANENNL